MKNPNFYLVVMAGGIGSRFWPFSRLNYPKQFHDILGTGNSLLQMTCKRFEKLIRKENWIVVTNKRYKDLVKKQLPELNDNALLLEPVGKNTAPCIAYASFKLLKHNPHAVMVVAPSDHYISDENEFFRTIHYSLNYCKDAPVLLTLGIHPTCPETGYGYIQYNPEEQNLVKKVKSFTEKPNFELAKQLLESGEFLWNSGIFIWSVKQICESFKKYAPSMAKLFEEGIPYYYTPQEEDFISDAYMECKNISIDYAILEKADNVFVIPTQFGWSDLGTWKSLYQLSKKTKEQNVISGTTILHDTKNSIIKTPKDKLVVIKGLDNFIVAEFDDVLMICPKDDEQMVKDFVNEAKIKFEGRFS